MAASSVRQEGPARPGCEPTSVQSGEPVAGASDRSNRTFELSVGTGGFEPPFS